ncbi:hypothetical protein FHS18_004012 [Paenibacillus phyllosphaerae]|uniref:Uncharacterized protein n=1 Tax=Paenibacillus phyllosphaerae TaxID=274593 RepID=A0A7W5FPE4_9BACL|nr:hypothetical protein [Paenibacillus phyllosphaerae]
MPLWMQFIADHWLPIVIVILTALAITYVTTKRKSLLYKE